MKKLNTLSLAGALSLGLGAWTMLPAGMGVGEFVAPDVLTVTLQPAGGSAASGTAELAAGAAGATMTIEVHDVGANAEIGVSLVGGTCAAPGEVKTALGSMKADSTGAAAGRVALSLPLDALLATPTAVQVRSGADASAQSVLCGEVAATTTPPTPDTPPTAPTPDTPPAPGTPPAPSAPGTPSGPQR